MIAAEGEQKASRALREASEVISDSSSALQLRYLQVILLNDKVTSRIALSEIFSSQYYRVYHHNLVGFFCLV